MFGNSINPIKIKQNNTKQLRKLGIDVIDHLPTIERNSMRTPEDIAKRCVVLAALLQLHFEAPREFIKNYLDANNLIESLSENEKKLLEVDLKSLENQEQINVYWFIEAVWALAWVGNLHNTLSFNSSVENSLSSMLPNFQENEPATNFINNFSIRKEKDVFITLDKFYRAHWFARNLSINNQSSPAVNLDFIMERRKALEWVYDPETDWDDISLNT